MPRGSICIIPQDKISDFAEKYSFMALSVGFGRQRFDILTVFRCHA